MSAFEKIPPSFESSEKFADYLKTEKDKYFGHPSRIFLDKLLKLYKQKEDLQEEFEKFKNEFLNKVFKDKKRKHSGQEARVAKSFCYSCIWR